MVRSTRTRFRQACALGYARDFGSGLRRPLVASSCYRREPLPASARAKNLFERALERTRRGYGFYVIGYVVMPEHVERPEDWAWSSFRHYLTGEEGVVEIESEWTARRRERMGIILRVGQTKIPTRANPARVGHPEG